MATGVFGGEVAVVRERDSADRSEILRWYDFAKREYGEDGRPKFKQCEGRLDWDFEVGEAGWYVLEQSGHPCEWNRTVYLDGRALAKRHTTSGNDLPPGANRHRGWRKEMNVYLEAGKHALGYERTSFPGAFPEKWRLVKSDGGARETVRARLVEGAVRNTDAVELEVLAGGGKATRYEIVAVGASNDETARIAEFETAGGGKPEWRKVRGKAPEKGGAYVLTVREGGKAGWKSDLAAGPLVVVDIRAEEAAGGELKRTLVVDIDCVKEKPYVERDGATRVVEAEFGAYRESSGRATHGHWALDGFSYSYAIPDIRHVYQLEVTYPDDKFRSVGFWSNDAGPLGDGKKGRRKEGQLLTGGVETGGQYRNTNRMLTHEAFFYPTGTNIVTAVVNLNRGSFAAAARIRVWRIDGPLPAAEGGARRGRLAGGFLEENGRWERFFGKGHNPGEKASEAWEGVKTMERWAEWNRFAGVNAMSPSVVAYGGVHYPSEVISGSSVRTVNEMRLLGLVAEKYGQTFIPHLTLHGDQEFDKRMGIGVKERVEVKGGKEKKVREPSFADPDVVEWSKDGTTTIPWRKWCYNCLHPKVQEYMVAVAGEAADMLRDTKSFGGMSLRVPLGWQFSGVTGLNNANYGYGDWTVGEFTKDTGIAVPGEAGDEGRFRKRWEFLMADGMRGKWLRWRNDRVKAYYRRMRDRINCDGGKRELYFMWWASSGGEDEMNECGIDPEYWKGEPGISFYGLQFFYGRRFFSPRSLFDQEHRLYDRRVLKQSLAGRRAVGIYSSYYEPNDHNFEWSKFGAKPYTAFDALEPAGEYERQHYAVTLAQLDAGVYFNGGNGWIFGTPSKTREYMREFLALPAEKFSDVAGVAQDPVAARELLTEEGRFVYFANGTDAEVKVEFGMEGDGECVGAADGKARGRKFTLKPFSMRSYLLKGKGGGAAPRVAGVKVEADPKAAEAYAAAVEDLEGLAEKIRERKAGPELRKDLAEEALGAVKAAADGLKEGRLMQVAGAVRNPKLAYALDLTGKYPRGAFESGGGTIGGYPEEAADKPRLRLARIWGGDPEEAPPAGTKIWRATDGERTWLSFDAGARGQLREFAGGKYARSAALTTFNDKDYNNGESRHGFLADPRYVAGGPIAWTNGMLYAAFQGGTPKFDPSDGYRQGVNGFGERVWIAGRAEKAAPELKAGGKNFNAASQLKVRGGKLLYKEADGVWEFDPLDGRRVKAAEGVKGAKGGFVFGVTPKGKIVTEPARGRGNVEQTDLWADDDGARIYRVGPWDKLKFEKCGADGAKEAVFDFDYKDFRQGNRFGFCRGADGTTYVAGAGSRRVAAYGADGKLKWERGWKPAQATALGDLPLRCPAACAVDGAGRLWVADWGADRIVALDARDGRYIGVWGESGTVDDRTGFGLSCVTGIAAIGERLYVLDSGNLRLVEFAVE